MCVLLMKLLNGGLILPEILFHAHEDEGGVGAVDQHLRPPLVPHVLQTGWAVCRTNSYDTVSDLG